MQTYHPSSNPPYAHPRPRYPYPPPQNGRPGNPTAGSGRGYPQQGSYPENQIRATPRPRMFPTSASSLPFRPLNPGEIMSGTSGAAIIRPAGGPGKAIGARPVQQRPHPSLSMSIGAGINDAGYPTMPTGPVVHHHAAHTQGPQQIYRPVPGMGPQTRSFPVDQTVTSGQQGIVNRMNQLSVIDGQVPNSTSHHPHERNQHPHLRPPPSSHHTSQQPLRSHSVGGASISSTASASTARTAGSSTGSSLNLHQHYVNGQGFAANDRRPAQMPSQQPQHVDRVSTSAALSQHGHNGNSGNVAGGGGENPLLDLLSSEREYVERLMSIVRTVAGAWSRANFPPPLLDRMFRSIEGIYKISKALVEKLDDLGANPSTPKALGDLLMQWVEDLIGPYTRYASIYLSGYDHFSSVANNQRLPGILAAISQALPPVPPLGTWTLDALFRLPYLRLRYYRRLYSKLLASATEGRSDYNMLKVAGDKLNTIVNAVEERLDMDVNQVAVHGEDAVFSRVKELRAGSATAQQDRRIGSVPLSTQDQRPHKSPSPSVDRGASKKLEEERRSVAKWEQQMKGDASLVDKQADRQAGTSVTSTEFEIKPSSPSSRTTITPVERPENSPLTDLEIRLDAAKAVDLFTMQLKACRLQIAPSTLIFSRHLRRATDTVIHFNPTSTKRQVVHRRAHIFVLTDLFLMCERMSVTEKAEKAKEVWANNPNRVGDGGPLPEMWLLYPPLAGRHLSVLSGGVETELIVTVMKRETFLLKFDDRQSREDTLKALQDCIDFASSVLRPGTSRSANNSPRLDGSMINDNRQNDRRYTQEEVAQDEMSYHRAVEGNITRTAQSMLTVPLRSTSYSPQPMHGPPAAYRNPPTHPSQPLYPSQPSHNGALLPRTASAPVPDSRYYNDDAASRSTVLRHAQLPYQAYTETLPHLQPHRSQSADVYGVTGRDGSVTAGRPHIPSTDTSHHMREIFNEADSPVDDTQQARAGPAVVAARLKCKVFLKHGHQQWKPLGPARLQLYIQQGTNIKQLVVEADTKEKTMLISTIVLTDGVERVAKTGVAVEISDGQGKRAGLIYMLKCEDEESAGELFSRLISGSDRARSLSVSRK